MKIFFIFLTLTFGLSHSTCQVGFLLESYTDNSTHGIYVFKKTKSTHINDVNNTRITLMFDDYAPLVITYDPELNEQCSMTSKKAK